MAKRTRLTDDYHSHWLMDLDTLEAEGTVNP
jgi:hypothetical protein